MTALATPLKLDTVVGALRDQCGYGRLVVAAMLVRRAANVTMARVSPIAWRRRITSGVSTTIPPR